MWVLHEFMQGLIQNPAWRSMLRAQIGITECSHGAYARSHGLLAHTAAIPGDDKTPPKLTSSAPMC